MRRPSSSIASPGAGIFRKAASAKPETVSKAAPFQRIGERQPGQPRHLVELRPAAHPVDAVRLPRQVLLDRLVLLVDLAHDLFRNVAERDDSGDARVFVHHHRERLLGKLELPQQIVHPLRLRNHGHLPEQRCEPFPVAGHGDEIHGVHHPDHLVARAEHRDPVVPALGDEPLDLLPGGFVGDRHDARPGRHHLADQHFVEFEHPAHHRGLVLLEDPLLLARLEKRLDLLVGGLVVRLRGERESAPEEVAQGLAERPHETLPAAEPGKERPQHVFGIAQEDGGRNQFPEHEPRRDEDAEGPQEAGRPEPQPVEREAEERPGGQEPGAGRNEDHQRVREALAEGARLLDALAERPHRDRARGEEGDLEEREQDDEESGDQEKEGPEEHDQFRSSPCRNRRTRSSLTISPRSRSWS